MSDFTEGFELVISTIDEDKFDWEREEYRPEYLNSLADEFKELGLSNREVEFEQTGVGVGAEGSAIALIIAGLTALFLSGKKINENIDAWIELSKKVKNVFRRLKPDYVSQPFAAAIALDEILKIDKKVFKVEMQSALIHVVPNPSMDMTGKLLKDGKPIQAVFRYQQMRYYTFVFDVYQEERSDDYWAKVPSSIHVICIRSTGEIDFHHTLPVNNWMKFVGRVDE